MKNRKTKTLIYEGLGFPIKLINVPMKKECGDWYIDIDMNKLMVVVLEALVHKPAALTGAELNFIRSYLQMTTAEFGKTFGVTHAAVSKWENEKNRISPAIEGFIRLHILDHLQTKDKEFRDFYKEVSRIIEQLLREPKGKIHPLVVDATTDELKIAL